jgi:hypothetical protein
MQPKARVTAVFDSETYCHQDQRLAKRFDVVAIFRQVSGGKQYPSQSRFTENVEIQSRCCRIGIRILIPGKWADREIRVGGPQHNVECAAIHALNEPAPRALH